MGITLCNKLEKKSFDMETLREGVDIIGFPDKKKITPKCVVFELYCFIVTRSRWGRLSDIL